MSLRSLSSDLVQVPGKIWDFVVHMVYKRTFTYNSRRTFASRPGDRGSIPGRDRPKSFKLVVTALLPLLTGPRS